MRKSLINKIQLRNLLLFLAVALSMSSCYNYRNIGLIQENNRRLPVYEPVEYETYRIKINDELIFRLITSDQTIAQQLSTGSTMAGNQSMISYRVFPDGSIDIPFVRNIPVVGLTLNEAAKVIEERFKEIIPDAAIKLTLANKSFTVIGEAGTGVYYIFKDKLTILQALSMSGDISYQGDYKEVRIIRETEDGLKILEFDIRPASIINSEYYYIYPNDIIYVKKDPSSFYKVNSYNGFIGLVSTSLSLLFSVLYYFK